MSESWRHAYFSSIRRFQKQKKINKSWHRSVRQKSAVRSCFLRRGIYSVYYPYWFREERQNHWTRKTTLGLYERLLCDWNQRRPNRIYSYTVRRVYCNDIRARLIVTNSFGHKTIFGRLLLTRYNIIFVSRSSFLHFVALKTSRRTWDVHNTSNYIIIIVVTSLSVCRAAVTTHIVLYCKKKKNVRTIH